MLARHLLLLLALAVVVVVGLPMVCLLHKEQDKMCPSIVVLPGINICIHRHVGDFSLDKLCVLCGDEYYVNWQQTEVG